MNAQNNFDIEENKFKETLANATNRRPEDVNLGLVTMLMMSLGFGAGLASRRGKDIEIGIDPLQENKNRIQESLLENTDINQVLSNEIDSISDKESKEELKIYVYNCIGTKLENTFYEKGPSAAKELVHLAEISENWNQTEIQALYDRIHNLESLEEAKKFGKKIQNEIIKSPDDPEMAFTLVDDIIAEKNISEMTKQSIHSILGELLKNQALKIFRENDLEEAQKYIEKIKNQKSIYSEEITKNILLTIGKEKIISSKNIRNQLA